MRYTRLFITAALLSLLAAPALAQSITLGNGGITVSVGDPRYPAYYPNQGQYYPPPAYYPQQRYYPQQQYNCCQHHQTYRDGHCSNDDRRYRQNYYYGQGRYDDRGHGARGRGKARGHCRR